MICKTKIIAIRLLMEF